MWYCMHIYIYRFGHRWSSKLFSSASRCLPSLTEGSNLLASLRFSPRLAFCVVLVFCANGEGMVFKKRGSSRWSTPIHACQCMSAPSVHGTELLDENCHGGPFKRASWQNRIFLIFLNISISSTWLSGAWGMSTMSLKYLYWVWSKAAEIVSYDPYMGSTAECGS